jgi:competence protein ComEC
MNNLFIKVFNRQHPILNRHSSTPAAAIAISFSTGIAFSLICPEYLFGALAAANLSLIGTSLAALYKDRLGLSLMLCLSAIMLGGMLMALAHRDGFSGSDIRSFLKQDTFPLNNPSSFEGCLISDFEKRGDDRTATIRLHAFLQKNHWIACKGTALLRIAELNEKVSSEPTTIPMRGDRIRGWVTWRIPSNFENPGSADRKGSLARRGIFVLGRVKSPRLLEIIPGDCSDPLTGFSSAIRSRVLNSLQPVKKMESGQLEAILSSLTIGDYSGLSTTTREIFQNSGTFHVLVVSGLHVAWIAGVLLQCCKFLLIPERIRFLLAALAIFLYACVVGFQASITRCLWVFILYLLGRMIFRRADPVNILFFAAIILLVLEPDWLFEVGFQLSFLSVMAIAMTAAPAIHIYLKPVLDPLRYSGNPGRLFLEPGPWNRFGRILRARCEILIESISDRFPLITYTVLSFICRHAANAGLIIGSMLIVSLAVQIWLEPLLAFHFNRISWIAPLANLTIVPFSSMVLAAGLFGSLTTDLPSCGTMPVQFAGILASLLLNHAALIAGLEGAWQRCPTPSPQWVLVGILLLFAWNYFGWSRRWIPYSYIVVLLACLSFGVKPELNTLFRCIQHEGDRQTESSPLSFTFLDVGEGDSIVIRFPNGKVWVLDAGGGRMEQVQDNGAYAFDIGEAVVSRYLWEEWITSLDRLILSHTDLDHAGGMSAVMKNFKITGFDCSPANEDRILDGILDIAGKKHLNIRELHAGMEEKVGQVVVRTLNPPADSKSGSANENSIVLQFCFKQFSALLTGDLDKTGEMALLSQPGDLRGRLLKVAHHGSRSGTSDFFLDRIKPRWAVISAGRNNPFRHPSPEVQQRLLRHGTRPILTIDEGAITFETNGLCYSLKSHLSGILEQGELY